MVPTRWILKLLIALQNGWKLREYISIFFLGIGCNFLQSRKNGARVGGVLYVYDISVKRSSGKAPLSRLRDPTTMPKTALVTTNWSSDSDGVLAQREHEMKETYWKAFIDGGLCVFRFHQTSSEAWDIINYLLDHMSDLDVPFAMALDDEST